MLQTALIPAEEKGSKKLLIFLHGLGSSMEEFRDLPRIFGLPWLNYLLVNAPDAYYGGFSWYDFAADPIPGIRRSYKAICALLEDLPQKGFNTEETILAGFSQGCLMSVETAVRCNHQLAGVIGVSGYLHEPTTLLAEASPTARSQRFLITHGTRDTLLPIQMVRGQVEAMRLAGFTVTWKEYDKGHNMIEPEFFDIKETICRWHGKEALVR
ncbi:MAG: alpha/beta hydrolase [Verrucomicrobiales bacterium]